MAFRQFERTSLQLSMGTLLSCLCASVAYADTLAPVKPASVDACVALASNADRLACYDAVFKPSALPVVQAAVVPEPVKKIDKPVVQPETFKEKVVDKVSNIKV
ncbi:phospholipase, partial [Acinetobacter baumannii]|nr:phospholipase [Acinetobacter baumannii]